MLDAGPLESAPKTRSSREVVGVDLLRFAAAAMVMAFHLSFWQWAAPQTRTNQWLGLDLVFPVIGNIAANGWVGVEIFFVISGFVIAWSSEKASCAAFVRGRFLRLAPAAWICSTISALALLANQGAPSWALARAYAKSASFFPTAPWIDDAYWTLDIEVAFYAFVALLLATGRRSLLMPGVGAIGATSALFWIGCATFGGPWWRAAAQSRYADLALLHHGLFFCVGVIFWRVMKTNRLKPFEFALALLCICGGALEIAASAAVKNAVTGEIHGAIVPAALWLASLAAMAVSIRCNQSFGRVRGARALGLATYPLYLLHTVVGGVTMKMVSELGAPPAAALCAGALVALGLAFVVSEWLEPRLRRALSGGILRARAQFAAPDMGGDFA